eukprot:5066788-Pyramimonas_sp.AAC.1
MGSWHAPTARIPSHLLPTLGGKLNSSASPEESSEPRLLRLCLPGPDITSLRFNTYCATGKQVAVSLTSLSRIDNQHKCYNTSVNTTGDVTPMYRGIG